MQSLTEQEKRFPMTLDPAAGYAVCVLVNMEGTLHSSSELEAFEKDGVCKEAAEAFEIFCRFATVDTSLDKKMMRMAEPDCLFHCFVHIYTFIKVCKQKRTDCTGQNEDNSAAEFMSFLSSCLDGREDKYLRIPLGNEDNFLGDGGSLRKQFSILQAKRNPCCPHMERVKWHVRQVEPQITVYYPSGVEEETVDWIRDEEDQDFDVCLGCGQCRCHAVDLKRLRAVTGKRRKDGDF